MGPMESQGNIIAEFERRKQEVEQATMDERDDRRKERAECGGRSRATTRGEPSEEDQKQQEEWLGFEIEPYEKLYSKNTEFFSTEQPFVIFSEIHSLLKEAKFNVKVPGETWQMKFKLPDDETKCSVNILKVDANRVCVEFYRTAGSQITFFNWYKEFKAKRQIAVFVDATETAC